MTWRARTPIKSKATQTIMGNDQVNESADRKVTVCSECLRACCWQGEFYCDNYLHASTVEKPISELAKLAAEHPHYWN